MNVNVVLISFTFLFAIMIFSAYFFGAFGVAGVHSPKFQFEKNYTGMKMPSLIGMNRMLTNAGMIENQTTTTIKLNTTQFQQIDKSQFKKAPEFAQINGYLNIPSNSPLSLSSLKGKVVLIYVWTYTCINSIRPMPYIDYWNQKYSNNGLVTVGVHSPEFQFEKTYANVKDAVQRFGIKYPVILATQILETLAKSGLPTRAEITDASMGHRAECVMLNKGKHILEAVKILSELLRVEERHHIKKRDVFTDFTVQYDTF